jgi:anti-sigma-K factor RskA
MNDAQHVLDLTAAHALGALPPEEAHAVEVHCASCASCAADLAEMQGLAATLPLACEQISPQPGLKRRMLAAARGDASANRYLRNPERRSWSSGTWLAAAAAALLVGVAFADHERMVYRMDDLQRDAATNGGAVAEIASAQRVWDLSGGTKDHWWHCAVVQPSHQGKAMIVGLMPPAPRGMAFQAWIIHSGKRYSAGMMPAGTTSMMHLPMPVQKGDVIAFSVEPMSGNATPTMPFAMEQQLD